MAGFDDRQLEEIRARADIVEIISAHVRLRQSGRNYLGLCPFHNEKTPSFTVSRERGFFHCFGCGAGGTVFNFLMRMEGLTFPEAVRALAQRYGIKLARAGEIDSRAATEREAMLKAAEMASEFYAHVLWQTESGHGARQYLSGRGVDEATARSFKLGFAPHNSSSIIRALAARRLLEPAAKIGLLRGEGPGARDMFAGRLIFSIRDSAGRVIAFGGRVLEDRLPKYINSPESPIYAKARCLYGLFEARQAIGRQDRAIVVEGYLDAIALWQAGFKETVASLGTSLTVEQLRLLGRYTHNVLACFDGDSAGEAASMRALRVFLEAGLAGRAILIPKGFDPDTLVRRRGAAAFTQLIDKAQLLVEYFVRAQAVAAAGISERAAAAERVAQTLAMIRNPHEFDLLTRRAAELLGVREDRLRRQAHSGRVPAEQTRSAPGAQIPSDGRTTAEFGVLAIAAVFPELRAEVMSVKAAADFVDREIAAIVEELCQSELDREATLARLAEQLSAEQQSRLSAQIVDPSLADVNEARFMLAEYASALARSRQEREIVRLWHQAAEAAEQATAVEAAQAVILHRRAGGHEE